MSEKEQQRYTRKNELVRDNEQGRDNFTGEYRKKNPYKTPPGNLTTKNKDSLKAKGGDAK